MSGWPAPYAEDALGRASRKAATAALGAHVAVLEGAPIRAAVSDALKEAGGLGGQERRFVAFAARELSRHQRLLDLAAKLMGQAPSAARVTNDQALVRYALWRRLFCGADWARVGPEVKLPGPVRPRTLRDDVLEGVTRNELPPLPLPADPVEAAAVQHSFPGWLARRMTAPLPPHEAGLLLAALNAEPRLTLRARPPGSREALRLQLQAEGVAAETVANVPDALRLTQPGTRVFDSPLMRQGRLQSQDAGSQLLGLAVRPQRAEGFTGATVVDACAGAGGKTLHLADLVGPTGRVFAHDKSARRLAEARTRVRELGLSNVQFSAAPPYESADAVLIDAPCSGAGSLAREPERKWRLKEKEVTALRATQLGLLRSALSAVRPDAVVVYATCSLLEEENEGVVEAAGGEVLDLSELFPAELCQGPFLKLWPHRFPGGGFFAARLKRRR